MAEDPDEGDAQKTEEPTQHRIEEAFKQGQNFYSKELTSFLLLSILVMTIIIIKSFILTEGAFLAHYLENFHKIEITESNLGNIFKYIISKIFILSYIPLLSCFIIAIISPILQTGRFINSIEPIIPKLEKISVMKGIGRLFSMKSLMELVKNIVKLIIMGFITFLFIKSELNKIKVSYFFEISNLGPYLIKLTLNLLKYILIFMCFVAIFDYIYQRINFFSRLKMSKYDLKQEYRQTEGNPEIKAKLKQIRIARVKKRMMAAVPKADVVIMNPTHYAVALKYEQAKMNAPIVIAKGKDIIALTIKEIALKNGIVIIQNPPLAKSLYDNSEIDQEIPIEHYKAVAEIISYVYKIRVK